MIRRNFIFVIVLVGLFSASSCGSAAVEAVSFVAKDNVKVFADFYSAGDKAKPIILLFHQAGSNRGEYATIAPMLVAFGFNALAVDQRAGGAAWGRSNETVRALGHSTGFSEALPDLEAAVAWAAADGRSGPIIAWGSSYSAALVFELAARHKEIMAVLAFSPGEYLGRAGAVAAAASRLNVPVFVTSAKDSGEIAEARAIFAAVRGPNSVQVVPKIAGVHGSSTLRSDRNEAGAADNWDAVKAFLTRLKP